MDYTEIQDYSDVSTMPSYNFVCGAMACSNDDLNNFNL